mmetsp:Transcript_2271/g.4200  ORF Transcript_2271/g.4200 Transcript_2271/m.4200 type:complete len:91 (+) Transcript_2271:314-586(+)
MNRKAFVIGRAVRGNKHRVDVDLGGADTSQRVSKKHAVIFVDPAGSFELANFSKNGTIVDDLLHHKSVARLDEVAKIRVGGVALLFRIIN